LTLQQFETVDLAFDLSIAPGCRKGGEDGGMITSYSSGEAIQLRDA
jgi:hypothetical protein